MKEVPDSIDTEDDVPLVGSSGVNRFDRLVGRLLEEFDDFAFRVRNPRLAKDCLQLKDAARAAYLHRCLVLGFNNEDIIARLASSPLRQMRGSAIYWVRFKKDLKDRLNEQ
jgi:hypothetical protein